jgi:hypothetical protein
MLKIRPANMPALSFAVMLVWEVLMKSVFNRAMLLLVLVFIVSCSTFPDSSTNPRSIEESVTKLGELKIPLQSDPNGVVRWIEAKDGEFNDEAMCYLPDLPELEWLEISKSTLSNKGLKYLKKCTGLKRLFIHDINLKGEDLAWISSLTKLEALALQNTQIDGRFLKYLNSVETLKVLNLSGNRITDDDMMQIVRFRNLEVLSLANTQISGKGIRTLEGMARLNEFNIENCSVLDNDLSSFLTMPNLRIVYATGCKISNYAIGNVIARFPSLAIFL